MPLYRLLFTCLAIGFSVISCAEKTETKMAEPTQDTIQKDSVAFSGENQQGEVQQVLEAFTEFPPEIDGCSCYYSLTDNNFKANKYVFASNFGKEAFIKVNGKMEKLKLVQERELSQTRNNKVYSGAGFLLTIEVEKTGSIDETWQQKGIIKLEQKNKDALINSIIGECGC